MSERILTTHGGRLPDPSVMSAYVEAVQKGDAAQADAAIRQGIRENVERQRAVGTDLMSDGEFWRFTIRNRGYYEERFEGIEEQQTKDGELNWFGQASPEMLDPAFARLFAYLKRAGSPDVGSGHPLEWFFPGNVSTRFAITEPIRYKGDGPIKRELALLREVLEECGVDHTQCFFPVLGPGWFTHFVFNEHYKTDEEFIQGVAEALRGEYQAVVDAGFILQIDDPSLADKFGMFNPPLSVDEYRRYQEPRIEATNHALRGLPRDRMRYHVCWGSFHFPHTRDIAFADIIDLLLRVDVQAYSIEAASVSHELDYKVWKTVEIPEGKVIIPGVISHMTSNRIEPPELVAERILQYAELFGRENVIAGVDCGPGLRCHDDAAWAKLAALRDGAALATQALWG
jgi:5-methyltetrahydropteroyltriglutamate--homocysteine methyltransferase